MKRLLLVGAAALIAIAGCSSPTPAPSLSPDSSPVANDPTLQAFYGQQLSWTNCGGRFECATMTVPLTYEQPDIDTIDIDLTLKDALGALYQALDQEKKQGNKD